MLVRLITQRELIGLVNITGAKIKDGVQTLEISASPTSNDVVGLQDVYLSDISSNFETVVDEISWDLIHLHPITWYLQVMLTEICSSVDQPQPHLQFTRSTVPQPLQRHLVAPVSSSGASGGTSYSGTTTSSSGTPTEFILILRR